MSTHFKINSAEARGNNGTKKGATAPNSARRKDKCDKTNLSEKKRSNQGGKMLLLSKGKQFITRG